MLRRLSSLIVILGTVFSATSCATQFNERPDVQQFIHGMVVRDNFNEQQLNDIFSDVTPRPQVIKLMTKPAEKKPWSFYRKLFISDKRINNGLVFWRQNARVLSDVERLYGVPASIVVAIIGIETSYGDNKGNIKTLDSLATLAFDYPPRAKFFQGELEQFLLLSRDLSADPRQFYGSYAGAIGYPQFMPSSYRKYGIDFNKNNSADLINDPVDAIGSVGNYLNKKGWRPHQPIAVRAKVKGTAFETIGKNTYTLKKLATLGVKPVKNYPADLKAGFLILEGVDGPEYWLVFRNFYVIKAYNSSSLYAMAVYQLSNILEQQRGE